MKVEQLVKATIRDIPDFPKEGIIFKDITPLLENTYVRTRILNKIISQIENLEIDAVIGIEARGFLFGMLIADQLGVPFIPVRKKGKLPLQVVSQDYNLEYGTATIEMHHDAINPGMKVLIHDDLLATGGTAKAAAQLVEKLGGSVSVFQFIIELLELNGREKLNSFTEEIQNIVSF